MTFIKSNLYTKEVNSTPLIFLSFKRPDRIVKEEDLGYVNFVQSGQSRHTASLNRSWRLATNPQRIIDVDFGTHKLGTGAFVLYEGHNAAMKLQFKVFTGETNFVAEAQCPKGQSADIQSLYQVQSSSGFSNFNDRCNMLGIFSCPQHWTLRTPCRWRKDHCISTIRVCFIEKAGNHYCHQRFLPRPQGYSRIHHSRRVTCLVHY